MTDPFTDPPTVPPRQGLQQGDCCDCGGPALVDAQYVGAIRCSACWTKFHNVGNFVAVPLRSAPRTYVVKPWISQGVRGARRSGTDEAEAAASRYRVITPARLAVDAELPDGARKLLRELDVEAHATYAAAEDLKLARLVETIAVRVHDIGYALWERTAGGAWRPAEAQLADPYLRTCSVTEFSALACGRPYAPPAKPISGPCPYCSTPDHPVVVRWKKDPFEPYAHNRPPRVKGEKIKCLPHAPYGSASQTLSSILM